jgi:ElaB/YqjD/DUF883 family membrane-anchored ribosome-binding protein
MPTTLHQGSGVQDLPPEQSQPSAWENDPGGRNVLQERATQVGSSLGRVVAALRNSQTKLRDSATQAKEAAVTQMQGMKRQIKTSYEGTREGAQKVMHDYPVHVVLAAGVVGLLLGMSLRIWRANHES